jgi:hypothetical protein
MHKTRSSLEHAVRLARSFFLLLVIISTARLAAAQNQPFYSHDNHTEYDLLDPSTHRFAIVYFLTERRVGATVVLNQTRSGSAGSDIAVFDPMSGDPLKFEYLTGAELSADGTPGRFDPQEHYIRAHLPRPVREGSEGRVKILKTYMDEKSYFSQGEDIVFTRSLGIARNAIVLPKDYNLVSSNVAAQILALSDGRLKISFEHANGYAADVTIRARKRGASVHSNDAVADRNFDFSKTLYDLDSPDSHRIAVTHEYVETRAGPRSRIDFLDRTPLTNIAVTDVDTGVALKTALEKSATFATLATALAKPSQSARVRVTGTLTDPGYTVADGLLAWERTLRAPRSTILLPSGWEVTSVSVPCTVSTQTDGRVAFQIFDGRPVDGVHVAIRASKR